MQFDLTLFKVPSRVNRACVQSFDKLSALRKELEAAAGEDSLLDISASVGLMLLDIATHLRLTAVERLVLLCQRLDKEVAQFVDA